MRQSLGQWSLGGLAPEGGKNSAEVTGPRKGQEDLNPDL